MILQWIDLSCLIIYAVELLHYMIWHALGKILVDEMKGRRALTESYLQEEGICVPEEIYRNLKQCISEQQCFNFSL